MENFAITVDDTGIATLSFDVPGKSLNTITASVQTDLDRIVERLRGDPAIVGAILRSGKATGFCAGADLKEMLGDIERWRGCDTPEERAVGVADAGGLSRRIRALETCGKPIVGIVEGLALGGGLELVLGCHHRLVVDNPDLKLSFPEVGIGLLPGAGGTQRLPRLIGLLAAMPYLLDAAPISLADAIAGGIFHRALPADALTDAARRWILDGGSAVAPWDEKGFKLPGGGPNTPSGYAQFGPAIAARLAGGHATAPAAILKCLYEGVQVPIDAGLRIENRYFFNTARSEEAAERIQSFLQSRSSRPKPVEGNARGTD
ncbi:enoyl-CoA hydratase/isomerase family protein [Sphingobium aromaticiconvertens]|uniref:enoyl-CoA hydratase/isomerase family protein n=1 Tax=Sphingobium aromaticiconvertens TaxID=365341 RepID=UPI00301AF2D3